jgi:hypothetical protein
MGPTQQHRASTTVEQAGWFYPARLRLDYAWPEASKRLCRALCRLERLCPVDTTAVTAIRQPLGPRFGYAFQLGQESSRTARLAILRPRARLQSYLWWFVPSLTKAIESGVERLTLAMSGYALVDADRRQLVRPITPVHRSGQRNCPSFLLGAVQGSVICHCGGIDEDLRGFFSIPGASRLRDACFTTDQPPG